MAGLKINDRVLVLHSSELRGTGGLLVAKYLPGFRYGATAVNLTHLQAELAAGRVQLDRENAGTSCPTAAESKVAAVVTVKPMKGRGPCL